MRAHDAFDALGRVLVHALVRLPLAHRRPGDLVEGALGFLPGAHVLAVLLPEVRRQRRHAAVEDVGVLERLVAVVVLGVHAEHRGLDAQVDVLGDQDHARIAPARSAAPASAPGWRCRCRWPGRLSGSALGELARLEEQPARGGLLAVIAGVTVRQLAGRDRSAPWWRRASCRRGSGSPGARCARLPTGPSCGRRAPRARSSAGRRRAPRSGRSPSGRASARSCRARTGGAVARAPLHVASAGREAGRGAGFRDTSLLQALPPRDRAPSPCATPAAARPCRRAGRCCARSPGTFCRTGFSL